MRHTFHHSRSPAAFLLLAAALFGDSAQAGKPAPEEELTNPAIVYANFEDGGLFVMSFDGASSQRLTEPPRGVKDSQPAWLPDGERISFTRSDDGALYIINSDGSGIERLRSFNGAVEPVPGYHQDDIVWGPYGERLVYASYGNGTGIWLVHPFAGGTERSKLAKIHAKGNAVGSPSFSPDEDFDLTNGYQGWLAWYEFEPPAAHLPEMHADIYAVRIEIDSPFGTLNVVGEPSNLTAALQSEWPGFYGHPSWSPDGQWLAFVEDTKNAEGTESYRGIDRIDWNDPTSEPIRLMATSTNASRISWTFGQCILFDEYRPAHSRAGRETFDLILMDPFGGGASVNLTDTDRINEWGPTWNPAWSPNTP